VREDIFTKRAITPPWEEGGAVARAQGFVHYQGADWRERRAVVAAHEPLYGSAEHPDPGKAATLWLRAVERELGPLGRNAVTKYLDSGLAPSESLARLARVRERLPEKARESWSVWLRKALACDGWLLPRHAVMPDHEEHDFRARPAAQLRPDRPLVMGAGHEWHHHYYDLRARERHEHEVKVCDRAPAPGAPGYPHPAAIEHPEGAFLPTGHLHPATGELVVPYTDSAGRYVRHHHWDQAKYIYTPGPSALRLGTNPVALERGWGGPGDLFVVVLEGTLKMCAAVEAGFPAIDAGSVTLWRGSTPVAEYVDGALVGGPLLEIEAFAERHLHGRPVAVVCDSDWHTNTLVADQTRYVVDLLRAKGADAVACAPPEGKSLGWSHPVSGVEQRAKVGLDDWLGPEHDGDLLDIVCRIPEGAATLTPDDPRLLAEGTYRTGREATARVLCALGEEARPGSDVVAFHQHALAERLGMPQATVHRALDRGVACGLAERLTSARRHAGAGRGSMTAPLVRVVPEALPRHSAPTLRSWLGSRNACI
jgi:hypothetical protein